MAAKDPAQDDEDLNGADRYRAPALDKGLDILEVLADQARGLTRAEIVKALGLSPSQLYRMLERLVARGYVCRDEGGDRYTLTMKLFLLATRHPPLRRLVAQAQPLMDSYARRFNQACHLVVPEQGKGVIAAQASPASHFEFRARLGAELDLFTTGSGMTILAFLSPARRVETLQLWGVAQPEARLAAITKHLEIVRAEGGRIGASGQLVGVTDISVPVLDDQGEAIAALTCAYIEHPEDLAEESLARAEALAGLKALAAEL